MPSTSSAPKHPLRLLAALLTLCIAATLSPLRAHAAEGIDFSTETLDNGLKVIYAPMPSSPVTQVRVLYHVGSRDERPDRQGFAHMFEHMMFRGSEHVKPQEHMQLVGLVGGYCNAFTSFDQTVYHDTLPTNYTDMALWLEADRMSSFKVSPQIFHTERLVVAEEWRMRQNQPYGTLFDVLCNEVFKVHPYQWTPIGNMEDLQAAATSELQAFFNKYYLPSNAVLVVAGNTDVPAVKAAVHKYFAWIPHGPEIVRHIPQEPPQTAPRREEIKMRVPLDKIVIAYKMAPIISDDREPLELLLSVLGDGRSSRLSRALVTNADPLCISADEINEELQDGGIMGVDATLAQSKDPAAVEKILRQQISDLTTAPVSPEELEKAKQQYRLALAQRWQTPDTVATELGEEMLFRGNLDRVNTARARLEAITAADLLRVAKLYFADEKSNTLLITPGNPSSAPEAKAATQPTTQPVAQESPRAVQFPADYPTKAPMTGTVPHATFEKGIEKTIDGVRVIVMEDHRLPLVNWSLTLRMGCFADPAGKEGLASLTDAMVRRGPSGKSYNQFNEELDSRGISLDVSDGGDITTLSGNSLTEQLPFGLAESRDILLHPAFDPAQFATLKSQALDDLRLELTTPSSLATRTLSHALYGDTPLGRPTTLESLASITLDDVKNFYNTVYTSPNAILMLSGDISVADGQKAAKTLLADFKNAPLPIVNYGVLPTPTSPHILLVDFPPSKQAIIQIGVPAYTIASDEKFAGSLAGQMLSNGIDSRLGQYVRAEKGYVYGIEGYFQPDRHAGIFMVDTGTKFETAADTIQATYKVLDAMKAADVPDKELSDSKFRIAGQLLMSMQTIQSQAARRVAALLNGYPADYYDVYPERISKVTADDVKNVMDKYVDENKMTIVVVAPAAAVKTQLEKIAPVQVLPAPIAEQP